ncbi:MAG: hypothetical protein ACLQMF_10170 [Rectinemataceae bacterium]
MRELLLSLGVLFGIVSPQPNPELSARLFQDGGSLYLNVELQKAVGSAGLAIIQAGNRMALELRIENAIAPRLAFVNQIAFDPVTKVFTITEALKSASHKTSDAAAALEIFSRFYALPIGSIPDAVFPLSITVETRLILPDSPRLDAGPLWNFKNPRLVLSYAHATEIPR